MPYQLLYRDLIPLYHAWFQLPETLYLPDAWLQRWYLAKWVLKNHLHIQLLPRYGKIIAIRPQPLQPREVHTRQNPQRDKGRWTQTPILYQEAICSWYLLGKGKISLQWSDSSSSTTLQGRSHV